MQENINTTHGRVQGLSAASAAERFDESVHFLERLRSGGPWVLTAILSDGPTTTITANSAAEVDSFVNTAASEIYITA